MDQIKTEYCTVESCWGPRQVRFLISGSGPLIFLLHQSPKSADEYRPQIEKWSDDFTIIAPDTPGYGDSDSLNTNEVTIEKIAQATVELADSLDIEQFGLYGFHTGAIISIAIAHQYPERVKAIAGNGVLVLTDQELENIRKNYLPSYTPKWDGSHLAWLWSRMREQLIFFPWHERTEESRMSFDISPPEILHDNAIEIMRAGNAYREAYGAAFEYRLEKFVPQLSVPTFITAGMSDPLCKCLEALTPSDCVSIEPSKTHEEALMKSKDILLKHPSDSLPTLQSSIIRNGQFTKSIIHSGVGDIKIEKNFNEINHPLLCVHPPGGSSKTIRFLTESLNKKIDIISMDLPGHGESNKQDKENNCVRSHTNIILEIIEREGFNQLMLLGLQASCASVLDAVKNISTDFKKIVLIEPWILSQDEVNDYIEFGLPEIEPDWSGGHLQQYWHMVRDSKLFWPWYNRTISGIIKGDNYLEETQLDIEVTEFIRSNSSWQTTTADQLRYPTKDSLLEIQCPILIFGRHLHPLESVYTKIAHDLENATYHSLNDNPKSWGSAISKFIS
jgi:pimeloyl-ACP methyl ester carboxylesterase